jgi:hypothetical protein
MLKKIGAEAEISGDATRIRAASKLILPGVGAFDAGMANLHASGLVPLLNERVVSAKVPRPRHLPGHAADGTPQLRRIASRPGLDRRRGAAV